MKAADLNDGSGGITQADIDAATAATVAAGGKSTDPANRLPGETASQANARITAGYKELLAKPVPSQEALDAGAKVKFVRVGTGGQGEYTVVTPIGYDGPPITTTQWTDGIIPATGKYTTGTSAGKTVAGGKVVSGTAGTTGATGSTGSTTTQTTSAAHLAKLEELAKSGKQLTLTDIIGSSIGNFDRDPVTGKKRTAQEIIKAALDTASKYNWSAGTSLNEATGKVESWNDAQKTNAILSYLSAISEFEKTRLNSAAGVFSILGKGAQDAGVRFSLKSDPTKWAYSQSQVGTIVPKTVGGVVEQPMYIVDPNNPIVPKDILAKYKGQNILFIDAITGNMVSPNLETGEIADYGQTLDAGVQSNAPVGTPPAFEYNYSTGKWEMPPKPTEPGSWVWDNTKGWTNTTVNPGSTGTTTEGGPTLAKDTFKNTLALFFGASEMSQPWVDALYKVTAGYVNSGSDVQQSLNLALQEARNNPVLKPFTDRFKGVYALQDRLAKGEAIVVPTIAEFFKTESAMGDVLRASGLGDLATQDFLGNVIGLGKSLTEVTNLIDTTFKTIDNAPAALKADLQTYFPGVDRTSIAKALLTGKEGWAELDRKVRGIQVLSAAKTQGVTVDLAQATNVADMGYDYSGALTGFQQVKELERGQMLGKISGVNFGQEQAVGAVFQKNAQALADIEKIKNIEMGKFSGSAGRLPSRMRGQGLF